MDAHLDSFHLNTMIPPIQTYSPGAQLFASSSHASCSRTDEYARIFFSIVFDTITGKYTKCRVSKIFLFTHNEHLRGKPN